MRHVLIICYDFPRLSAAGVIRTYALAKNLSLFGWQPVLLTAQSGCAAEDNIEMSDGLLNCVTFTTAPTRLRMPLQENCHRPREPLDKVALKRSDILKRLEHFASQLAVPDGKIGWLHTAVKSGLRIARDYSVKLCLSVSPRPTSHLVGRRLGRSLGIPWVADFALPWSDAYWLAGRPQFSKWLDQQLEGSVVRAAQHITVAYEEIARFIRAQYGAVSEGKISIIPTGYDNDLFEQQSLPRAPKFRVVYPGNHFCEAGRNGECFLQAIDQWLGLNPHLAHQVEAVFIGKQDNELLQHRTRMMHPAVVRIEPLISHRACIQAILSSDMCIVNAVGNRIPAKVYECMRAGKWVLALANRGSGLDNLMGSYSRGISIPPRDIPGIRSALQSVYQCSRSEEAELSETDRSVASYSSKEGTQKVAAIFESLLASAGNRNRRPI
jgi:glycosyltransferase involved in cell wall biosynthesis